MTLILGSSSGERHMVLLKSVLAGLGAVAIAMLAMVLYAQSVKYRLAMSVGIDFRAILFTSALMFAAGFWWQYSKAR
jgi:hypothetical protein